MKRDILYVDDEPENTIVFQAAFENEFRIWTANDGRQALELLEQIPFPVVVADQRMPEMSGVELFEVVRSRYPFIKRILLTGYTDPAATIDAINKGQVFQFVTKPWERHELLSVLIRAVEAHDLAVTNTALTDRLLASERHALLGRATARLTHEIKNQLCIFPLLETIGERYPHDAEMTEIADFAMRTYERLVVLVEEVKGFVRLEQDDFPKQTMRISDVIHELVSFLRFDHLIPHDRLSVFITADPLVHVNKLKLQQVLLNLVKNAADAIRDVPHGRIMLTADRHGAEAIVSVQDTGCGMSPATLARIWEPFFTTKGSEGTGLGLDICRRLVESHRGQISCHSDLGAGTIFTVRLPAAEHSDQPEELPALSGSPG
jgi:signal transduction histidine kinase